MSIPEVGSRNRLLYFLQKYLTTLDSYVGDGAIIGYSGYDPGTADSQTISGTSFAYIVDSAANKKGVTFVAPSSGIVEITLSIWIEQNALIGNPLIMALTPIDGVFSTYAGTMKYVSLGSEHTSVPTQAYATMKWVLYPGGDYLIPGETQTFYLGAKTINASDEFILRWGGSSGGYPVFVMKAVALPATIGT